MSEVKQDEVKKATSFPKKAQDIQKFCFKHFQNMPVTISESDRGFYLLGPAKTFIIFLDTPEGDIISLSLLGDVAQSAHIFHTLANEFGLEMTAPCCEDATDGAIKFDEAAYVALIQTRAAEAAHNLKQAQDRVQEATETGSVIVGADGESIKADSPIILS